MEFILTAGSETLPVEVIERDGRHRVRLGEEWVDVDARRSAAGAWSLLIAGASHFVDVDEENDEVVVGIRGETYRVRVEESGRAGRGIGSGRVRAAGQRLVAPMPGKVVAVHVQPGDRVEPGAPLIVLEAMKMENEFRATGAGVVAEVGVTPGQPVNAGDLLLVVAPAAP